MKNVDIVTNTNKIIVNVKGCMFYDSFECHSYKYIKWNYVYVGIYDFIG